jgi:putative ABC transport system substrate-binding protein
MRRREFITLLGGAVGIWPVAARAQQGALPVIGWLSGGPAVSDADWLAAFRQGLREGDFVEGQNVLVEYRWAEDHNDRLRGLADDLVARRVAVIVAAGGTPTALAKDHALSVGASGWG